MAVAYDAQSSQSRAGSNGAGDPISWTHTPVGTPRGVILGIARITNGTGVVNGSPTYGGVAMTKIGEANGAGIGNNWAEIWYLGSGIPSGPQTVSVDLTVDGTNSWLCQAVTVTAGADTEVVDWDTLVSVSAANPQISLQFGGRTCLAVGALASGVNAPGNLTAISGTTTLGTYDAGNNTYAHCRRTTAGSSDVTLGWTAASDSMAMIAAAISEIAGGAARTIAVIAA